MTTGLFRPVPSPPGLPAPLPHSFPPRRALVPVLALALVSGALVSATLAGEPAPGEAPGSGSDAAGTPVAVVDGTPIPARALEDAIQGALLQLKVREDLIRRQALDELVGRVLLEREAKARGTTVEALEKAEITDKAAVSEAEARSFYERNRARFGTTPEDKALQQIRDGLGRQRESERRAAFSRELREKHDVKVLLEPYRVPLAVGDAPVRGNPAAPVTVVEFSDFECPYCGRARPTVFRVLQTYGDKVRWVFRHFPLDFHSEARKAGEAAVCAGDQGHFWEMHDRLFAHQGQLDVPDLKAHAAALGLDTAAFDQCLDSGRHAARVEADSEEGARLGVSGTPAFFIDGRPLVGAQPFDSFAEIIDDELARMGKSAARPAADASGGR
jgi:predicted DsbA family dithiol-disulfide isomerase